MNRSSLIIFVTFISMISNQHGLMYTPEAAITIQKGKSIKLKVRIDDMGLQKGASIKRCTVQ